MTERNPAAAFRHSNNWKLEFAWSLVLGHWCFILGGVIATCLLIGCGPSAPAGPETVPVKGRVEVTKGATIKDLANRSFAVEFQSVEKPDFKAFGAILEDGTFTMTTQVESTGKPGAVPGTHRVRLSADESAARFVNPKFMEFETSGITVKVPSDTEIVLKVWR
jgi:hypothetical protein